MNVSYIKALLPYKRYLNFQLLNLSFVIHYVKYYQISCSVLLFVRFIFVKSAFLNTKDERNITPEESSLYLFLKQGISALTFNTLFRSISSTIIPSSVSFNVDLTVPHGSMIQLLPANQIPLSLPTLLAAAR